MIGQQPKQTAAHHYHIDTVVELLVILTLGAVTLLYSPVFADNFLAKSAVASGLSLWLGAVLWLHPEARKVGRSGVIYAFLSLFLLQALGSAYFARNPFRGIEVWLGYLGWLALLFVGSYLARDPARLRRILRAIQLISILVAILGILQYRGIDLVGLPPRYLKIPVATLGNTNFVAHYLDLILPLSAALLLARATSWGDRLLAAVALAACSTLLFLTDSFGGVVSIAAAVVVIAVSFVHRPRTWLRRSGVLVLCVVLLSAVAEVCLRSIPIDDGRRTADDLVSDVAEESWATVVGVLDRPGRVPGYSSSMRILIWQDGWRLAKGQGWFGVGPGHWGTELPKYRTSASHRDWRGLIYARHNQAFYAHQEFLQEWGETGLPGALCLVALLGTTFILCWRVARSAGTSSCVAPLQRTMGFAALAAVTAASTHALFSFNLRDPVVTTHLWLIVGLALGAEGAQRRYAVPAVVKHVVTVVLVCLASLGTWLSVSTLISDAHFARGLGYVHLRQGNRAVLEFGEAIAWRGHEYLTSHWLGKVHLEMGRPRQALPPLQHSLQLHAHNDAALRLAARAAIELEQPELAVDLARQAVAVDPLAPDDYQLLALAQRAGGRYEDAVAAWRQAVAFHPEDAELLAAMAQDLHAAGQTLDAVFVLQQALTLKPQDGRSHGNLGAFYLQLRRLPEAESHLRQALQLDRANGAQWSANLVQTLMLQEQWTQALKWAQSGLSAHPEDERLRHLLRTLEDRQEIR
ncbi:MAG: tetratricopeptide repeat protein [Gemmatimonadetes bacterium]|nr:tetratricopeptide repeat protein [Gemmatimonadota bacterium]